MSQHTYPVLPLYNLVMFPHLITAIQTNDPYVQGLLGETSRSNGEFITSLMLEDGEYFHQVGCLVRLEEIEQTDNGMVQITIRGLRKFFIENCPTTQPIVYAEGHYLQDYYESRNQAENSALKLSKLVKRYIFLTNSQPEAMLQAVAFITDPAILSNFCAHYFMENAPHKQDILQSLNIGKRVDEMIQFMSDQVQDKIAEQSQGIHVF